MSVETESETLKPVPAANHSIRLLLADDHTLVRAGFRSLLTGLGFQVIAEASSGLEALRLIQQYRPDVALVDIAMPELTGIEVAEQARRDYPQTRVVMLSMHATAEYARRAVRAGAAGYVLKNAEPAELQLAISAVARGESYLSPAIAKYILTDYQNLESPPSSFDRLSPRLRQILQLIAQGYSRKDIAAQLNISVKTFDGYRAQLMEELGIRDSAGLVHYAIQHGLLPHDPPP